jgi:hypothetical protein
MTQAQHTPGPWAIDEGIWGERVCLSIIDADLCIVAEVTETVANGKPVAAANARLIAAAPSTLEALKALTAELNLWGGVRRHHLTAVLAAANAAISAATGED